MVLVLVTVAQSVPPTVIPPLRIPFALPVPEIILPLDGKVMSSDPPPLRVRAPRFKFTNAPALVSTPIRDRP